MDFVKKHLFFIALIGAVIVVVGGAVAITLPKSSENKVLIKKRQQLSSSLMRFGRSGGGYSQAQVEQIKASVESRQRAEAELTAAALEANRQRMESLKISDPQTGEAVAILPIDPNTHERLNVGWHFPDVYLKAMSELPKRLNATMPPNAEERELAAKRADIWLKQQQQAQQGEDSDDAVTLPPGVPPPATPEELAKGGGARRPVGRYRGGLDDAEGMPIGTEGGEGYVRRDYDRGTSSSGTDAKAIALERLNYERVTDPKHPIYAYEGSFDYLPLVTTKRTQPKQIWKATVMYWLQGFLVDALRTTNQEALAARQARTPPGEPKAVLTIDTAAVKRLVKVTIGAADKLYAYELNSQSGSTRGGGYDMGQMGDGSSSLPPQANLTQRNGTQDYDVVLMRVEVIANPAELPKFMRNLTNRGFFTILDVQIAAMDQEIDSTTGSRERPMTSRDRSAVAESDYYYGSEPIVRVALTVEALLFADWSRPLMPVEMLSSLPESVLRPDDKERIEAASSEGESEDQDSFGRQFGGQGEPY